MNPALGTLAVHSTDLLGDTLSHVQESHEIASIVSEALSRNNDTPMYSATYGAIDFYFFSVELTASFFHIFFV